MSDNRTQLVVLRRAIMKHFRVAATAETTYMTASIETGKQHPHMIIEYILVMDDVALSEEVRRVLDDRAESIVVKGNFDICLASLEEVRN